MAFNLETVTTKYQTSYRIRGSRFLGCLLSVSTVEQFDLELGNIKSEHPAASHHCYAWRIQPSNVHEYSQDDGEPPAFESYFHSCLYGSILPVRSKKTI